MKLRLPTLTFLLFIFSSINCFAQTTPSPIPSPSETVSAVISPIPEAPTPTVTPETTFSWPDQISGIEYNLAEYGYQVNKTRSAYSRLIFAAEQLIGKHCIKDISPYYDRVLNAASDLAPCNQIIKSISKVDPDNPVIICLTKGYDSPACTEGFGSVKLDLLSKYPSDNDKDLDAAIAQKIQDPNDSALQFKYANLRQQYSRNKSEETKQELLQILDGKLQLHCTVVRYYITAAAPTPSPAQANPSGTKKPFQEMLDQLNQRMTPTPTSLGATHTRLVTPSCYQAIQELRQIDPTNGAIACLEKGPYSPQCLFRARPTPKAGETQIRSGKGFDPF